MTLADVVYTGLRWMGLAALAALVGTLVLDLFVLPPARPDVAAARGRLRHLGALCLALLGVSSAGELVARAQTMAGGLAAAIPALPLVFTRTHFGTIWTGRLAAITLALVVAFTPSRAARVGSLLLALALTVTTALTGHAADWGDITPTALIDWLHVVSASAWTGGLLGLALCVLGPARDWSAPALGQVMRRFSRLAGCCLLAVVVTGTYNAWIQLRPLSTLWTTTYGRVLGVKLLVVLALVWWGALSRYTIMSRLGEGRPRGLGERLFRTARLVVLGAARVARPDLLPRLGAYVRREALLAVLVFGCTAVLVDSTPARHAGHTPHQLMLEPGPFRVTMEELHESGGVPPGWIFVPPSGNAAHGREVFVRVGCYVCHRIQGQPLPASSGLGPDLTGVGRHHPPGYLLESILNPNAVIVQGSGYTNADGKSIMPDYREQLSVADLLDLVAYLKSL